MTAPSGTSTSRSRIAFLMRAWRWMVALYMMIESSMSQNECTRTPGERMLCRISLPETMHPIEMRESMANPLRPSSLNTNFAGGNCGWYVRSGHSGSYRLKVGSMAMRSIDAS
jgi:hypothetical protein